MPEINPYTPPLSNPLIENGHEDTQLFNTRQRIGRLRYSAYLSLIYLFVFLFVVIFGFIAGYVNIDSELNQSNIFDIIKYIAIGLLYLFIFISIIILNTRRVYDLNQRRWLAWAVLIPIVGIVVMLYMFIAPGTQGPNTYGLPPKKNSIAVIIGGLIIPVIMIFSLLVALLSPSLIH